MLFPPSPPTATYTGFATPAITYDGVATVVVVGFKLASYTVVEVVGLAGKA